MVANIGGPPDLLGTVRPDTGPGTPLGQTLATCEPVVIDDWKSERRFVAGRLVTEHGIASSRERRHPWVCPRSARRARGLFDDATSL